MCNLFIDYLAIVVIHLVKMPEVGRATPNFYWTILIKYRFSEFPLNLVALTRIPYHVKSLQFHIKTAKTENLIIKNGILITNLT